MKVPPSGFANRIGINYPIIQAPMAGANDAVMAAAVSAAGGLGSLPCGMLDAAAVEREVGRIREHTQAPFNLNFLCHTPPQTDPVRERAWVERLHGFFQTHGIDPASVTITDNRAPFDADMCTVVEALRPAVVSFHYGLPKATLLDRVRATGCLIMSSATTVAEAVWLTERGVDAVIAQGYEAGGHRGMFLTERLDDQVGTMALVRLVTEAVPVPVIACGGIADARGVAAARLLGADAVQVGTAYLHCPEATISLVHRNGLAHAEQTWVTNVLTGRPARGLVNRAMRELGPLAPDAPPFPLASAAMKDLRAAAEAQGLDDFSPVWAGQAFALGHTLDAAALTLQLAEGSARLLGR